MKVMTHTTKMEVIQRKEEGQGDTATGRAIGLAESTVMTIWN